MKYFEYVQRDDKLKMSIEEIEKQLNERPIKRWVMILHDKDVLEDGTLKPAHWHIDCELYSNQKIETIASWFNDEQQYIEKAKTKGKFCYNNMISYIFHRTDSAISDGKYKYEVSESKANFNVSQLLEIVNKDISTIKEKQAKIKTILNQIIENNIPRIELFRWLDNETILKNKNMIDKAYQLRDIKIRSKMEEDREMKVIYCYGPKGTGKTTYAKLMARAMNKHFYVTSSGTDPLGEYDGQEVVILDDMRKDNFSYSELLKFLDNNTYSFVKSRYSNKCPYNCQLLIITSIKSPYDLYEDYREEIEEGDDIGQFLRRIGTLAEFNNDNKIKLFDYDKENTTKGEEFKFMNEIDNPSIKYVEAKEKAPKTTDFVVDMTGKIFEMVNNKKIEQILSEDEPWN